MSWSSKALPQPALKNQICMRYWNKNQWQAAVTGPASPTDTKSKRPCILYQKSLPWNSTVQPPREPQLTSGDTSSFADKLPLSCSSLHIMSVFRGSQNSSFAMHKQHKLGVQKGRAGLGQLRGSDGALGQAWPGAGRTAGSAPPDTTNSNPFYLYLPGKQGGDCARAGLHRAHDWRAIKAPASVRDRLTVPHIHSYSSKKTQILYNHSPI